MTSGFSRRRLHPVHHTVRAHLGVDYAAPTGTPVVAVASGVVVSAGWAGGGGRQVRIRHASGFESYYLHLSAFAKGDQRRRARRSGTAHRTRRLDGHGDRSAPRLPAAKERRVRRSAPRARAPAAGRTDSRRCTSPTSASPATGCCSSFRRTLAARSAAGSRRAQGKAVGLELRWRPFIRSGPCARRRRLRPAVSSVPYDVVSVDEARQLAAGNPLSFLHVTRSEIDLPPAPIRTPSRVYELARENLAALRADGAARRRRLAVALLLPAAHGDARTDRRRRLLLGRRVRTGRHQEARADAARQGRRSHAAHRRAAGADRRGVSDLSRVGEGGRGGGAGDRRARRSTISRAPTACSTRCGGRRRPRRVRRWTPSRASRRSTSPTVIIARRARRARGRRCRRRSAAAVADAETFIAVAFPHDQMQILPYNRTVKDLAGRSPDAFLAELRETVQRRPTARPRRAARARCRCTWPAAGTPSISRAPRPEDDSRASGLDVALLQRQVLEQLLGIGDIRTDKRIDFVGGARGTDGLEQAVDSGKAAVAFSMYPGDDRRPDGDLRCRRHHAAEVDLVRAEAAGWLAG